MGKASSPQNVGGFSFTSVSCFDLYPSMSRPPICFENVRDVRSEQTTEQKWARNPHWNPIVQLRMSAGSSLKKFLMFSCLALDRPVSDST